MSHNPHHEHLIAEVAEMLKPVLSKSPQAIYVYLDDEHKVCNKKFSDMLGYKSPKEWADFEYPVSDVLESEQEKGIKAYLAASEKFVAGRFEATWVSKSGKKIKTEVIMAPFTYKGEVFVLHFISPKK